jgi:trehalose utilization protein
MARLMIALAAFTFFAILLPHPVPAKDKKIHVLCWSERTEPANVYPNGINGALVEMLSKDNGIVAEYANLDDPEQGLSEAALAKTDVLIWFGHRKHAEVTQAHVDAIVKRVEEGMGYVPLHSAHYAHPFQKILRLIAEKQGKPLEGEPGSWGKVRNEGQPELIHILMPQHPIAHGVKDFTIPKTETYSNPFNVPTPDAKILEGHYEGGTQDGNDGLLWNFGNGKVFYFRPGHETYPIFYQAGVRQILKNAVRFLASRTT